MSAKTILALDTKTGDQATVHTPPEHLQWLSVDFIKERHEAMRINVQRQADERRALLAEIRGEQR